MIDKIVLGDAGLKIPYWKSSTRTEKIIEIYNRWTTEITEFIASEHGRYLVSRFKGSYPDAEITEMKMTDLVLWKIR